MVVNSSHYSFDIYKMNRIIALGIVDKPSKYHEDEAFEVVYAKLGSSQTSPRISLWHHICDLKPSWIKYLIL